MCRLFECTNGQFDEFGRSEKRCEARGTRLLLEHLQVQEFSTSTCHMATGPGQTGSRWRKTEYSQIVNENQRTIFFFFFLYLNALGPA